jgi:cytochrome c oxidase subunit 2
MAWFYVGFRDFAWLHKPPKDSMDVYVMGKKWMWKYSYPEGPNSVDVLRVPMGRPVRLLITSRDVIHSFYAPAMRVKQDAVPGRYTETWFEATMPGIFPIYCTEYCGLNHSTMIGRMVVMKPEEFDTWMTETRRQSYSSRVDGDPSLVTGEEQATMVAQGARLALEKGCARCHTVDGLNHLGPTWKDMYRSEVKLTNGKTVIADEAYLTRSMMDPLAEVVAGYAPTMPSFQGQLSSGEAAALVEYIKSLAKDKPTTLGALP